MRILCAYVNTFNHIQVAAVSSRGGIDFWGLERGAPIVCFGPVGAKGPSRGFSREKGRGGAAERLAWCTGLFAGVAGTSRADMIAHHGDEDLVIAI